MDNNYNYNDFLDKSVVVNTYFSKTPIIGEVVETTDNSITIAALG